MSREELERTPVDRLQELYRKYSREHVYDYRDHVSLAQELDEKKRLPASFMVVAPGSWCDEVWDDVNRMRTLNSEQARKRLQLHICPLQFDIVERLINRYSNSGELVYDPFGGLGTVPLMALKLGRKGLMCELSGESFQDAVGHLQRQEERDETISLFDILGVTG